MIIIGLGNPILGDDGVGWVVARRVELRLVQTPDVQVEYCALGGLSLMERLVGCDRAILIDSIVTGQYPPGSVMTFPLEALPAHAGSYTGSAHDASLQDALEMAHRLGASLPEHIDIVAVEIAPEYEFSEQLSEPVLAAVPAAERLVWNMIHQEVVYGIA
jgi:hydrogenase maturation protease